MRGNEHHSKTTDHGIQIGDLQQQSCSIIERRRDRSQKVEFEIKNVKLQDTNQSIGQRS